MRTNLVITAILSRRLISFRLIFSGLVAIAAIDACTSSSVRYRESAVATPQTKPDAKPAIKPVDHTSSSLAPLPVTTVAGVIETGYATYYSDEFNGRKTASGEIFDMNALTAAHRTLPFGTKVRITNPRNAKSVIVRINDRMPVNSKSERIIDLSLAAAKSLDLIRIGVVKVSLSIVE
ncbi:MAG: septal ring lytic transglycosylase RlpA family protein [Rhizobacter sp.]|nr:septal ring lytic transglycosylase RlpA family protein [Chlorobiales bacterium]